MNTKINTIIADMQDQLSGAPWYGKSAKAILEEIDQAKIYIQPNKNSHSLVELLYHMVSWMEFTRHRIAKNQQYNIDDNDSLDWRVIDPHIHNWSKGTEAFSGSMNEVIAQLKDKDDSLLDEKVDFREYNFQHLLTGLIQHNIYHLGQIAYVGKLLAGDADNI